MKKLLSCVAMCAGLAVSVNAHAQGGGVNIGTLTCHVASGWGLIFGSSRALRCHFTGKNREEDYNGDITRFGVDIGFQRSGVIVWTVFAPTGELKPGALAGSFGGVSASAAAGVGLGANVLVGGSGNHINLQPLSITGKTGLNVAAGIAGLNLRYVPRPTAERPAAK